MLNPPRRIFAILLVVSASLVVAGADAPGDDTALFSNNAPPNVMLVVDRSGSMRNIIWHPAFAPGVVNDPTGCPVLPVTDPAYDPRCQPDPLCDFVYNDGRISANSWQSLDQAAETQNGVNGLTGVAACGGNTRDLFPAPEIQATGSTTRWFVEYINWYMSDNVERDHDGDGRTILQEILDTNDGQRSVCVLTENPSLPVNYAKYKRSRMQAAKEVLKDVICRTSAIADLRFGLSTFEGGGDPQGGRVMVRADDKVNNGATLNTEIDALSPSGWTPLSETMYFVYEYFMHRSSSSTAIGDDGTRFDAYNRSDVTGSVPPHPVTADCQKHFVLILTDGEPTKDDFDSLDRSEFQGLIGDYNLPGDEDELPDNVALAPVLNLSSCGGSSGNPNACEVSLYLDDIAKFMHTNDFFPGSTYPSDQTIDVYTVGFSTSSVANDLLSRTALAGGGEFFNADTAEALADQLVAAITSIVAKSQSFTAATVPASRATDGNNFFASYFNPSTTGPFWQGHLKLFEFNAAGQIRDKPTAAQQSGGLPGDCALDDPNAGSGSCAIGRLKLELDGYWDAANEIPLATARDLYVSDYASGIPGSIPSNPIAFDEGNVTKTALGVTSGDVGSYSGIGAGTGVIAAAGDPGEALADAVVRYLRGCVFGEATCTDRGDGQKLWDVFHSNPVVVGPPNQGLPDISYRDFISRYKTRKRVIYAGSNGGFIHGFNAGEYGTTAVPDGYDRETSTAGQEEFGFMAYPARQNIAKLPLVTGRGYGSWNGYSMDGSPAVADVWLYPAANIQPDAVVSAAWNNWRTALVGGMREGGRVIWALDVTNPPDHDDPSGEQPSPAPSFPEYMWEFPCEDATDARCTGQYSAPRGPTVPAGMAYADYMGETWSQPVITRIKMTVNCSVNCEHYDRWVAIFGAGYDPAGDPNKLHNSSTAAGARATDTVAGDYDASADATTSRSGRAIFMVDITTGEVIAMRRYHHDATQGDPAMKYAFAAAPAVFDLNSDGYSDVAYFGDLGGNLWKWAFYTADADPINASTSVDVEHPFDDAGDSDPSNDTGWKWLNLVAAENCDGADGCTGSPSPEPHYKSFFFPPQGALVGQNLWLTIGSGERNDVGFEGTLNEEKNRYYVFRDEDPLEREFSLPSAGTPRYTDKDGSGDFVNASTLSGACVAPSQTGYYFEGITGEKFITNSEIFFGTVLAGSYVPNNAGGPCAAAGSAFLFGFKLLCGEGALPDPGGGGGTVVRVALGDGLPNDPRVSVGPVTGGGGGGGGPCTDMVLVISSEGSGYTECPGGRPGSGVEVETWRDR